VEAGKLTVEKISFSPTELLSYLSSAWKPKAAEKGVLFATRRNGPITEKIVSDPTRLRQVLSNLVSNAVKFTEEGFVTVTAELRGASLFFEVQDSGCGISPE